MIGSATAQVLLSPQAYETHPNANRMILLEVLSQPSLVHPKDARIRQTDFFKDGWVVQYDQILNMLPPEETVQKLLRKLDLSLDQPIALIRQNDDMTSWALLCRVFWSLRLFGFDQLYVLEERPSKLLFRSAQNAQHKRTGLTHPHWLASYDQVYAGEDYGTPVFDIRDQGRAGGEEAAHPMAGRPGKIFDAFILPPAAFFRPGLTGFKSIDALKDVFSDLTGTPPGPLIFYSDTGLRAAIGWFVARELLGFQDVRLYDGSYLEWESLGHEVYDETDDMGGPIGG